MKVTYNKDEPAESEAMFVVEFSGAEMNAIIPMIIAGSNEARKIITNGGLEFFPVLVESIAKTNLTLAVECVDQMFTAFEECREEVIKRNGD